MIATPRAARASRSNVLTLLLFGLIAPPFASADITIDTNPQTTPAAVVETVSLLDASGIPITTANDPADNAWYVPLTGPASSPTGASWGARIQYSNDALNEILPIAFGSPSSTSSNTPSQTATLSSASSPDEQEQDGTLEIPLTSSSILLGKDSTVTITTISDEGTNITSLSTLPVGLNLGLQGKWNGSLVLGGNYDSNRIYDESHWQTLSETSAGNTSFITTGIVSVSAVVLQLYSSTPNASASAASYPFDTTDVQSTTKDLPAVLNFTSEVITVPEEKWCGRNISVLFNPTSEEYPEFEIPIWAELIPAGERPFFQAAYFSITTENLDVKTKTFDLHVALSEDATSLNGTGGNGTGTTGSGKTSAGVGGDSILRALPCRALALLFISTT
ncbi:hypothetical protein BO70DRAFT_403939 [Aspergillus heteromorphus CBS 117.55]|uniref:Uncharacterized protein n=1 Tax=Aspergillus heteromorphus CBS 117.55 TaxID=1448321 RepID=A0A317WAU4_9EURO|nr:uncharacterized protein BO70DRAFT_403939 [Aspergillus heteromorphus CBS 117.55]PWY83624.1 hypothetical protein BO70DRAFT_403939 [Aspergillus heteromorphus CBS 117.55]